MQNIFHNLSTARVCGQSARMRLEQFTTNQEAVMKRLIVGVAAGMMLVGSMVFAQSETPGIDRRQANQEQRIDQGIASGQLTEREAARLERQQNRINRMEDRAKSDGVVTKKERARIKAAQDRASRDIFREKHDRQGARHR
ncbi:MAG: hypothetical protein KatS3mg082_2064 [Nitrospiraceae bacterium]|nr:MAG: hypothetical protein KatS3mg082_2064 [Nitrospiraceae bacterium]